MSLDVNCKLYSFLFEKRILNLQIINTKSHDAMMWKMSKLLVLTLLVCVTSFESFAQVRCSNKLLADLVGQLPDIRLDEGFSGEVMIPAVSRSKPVIVQKNSNGVIEHVGIKFFDRDVIRRHPSPIYHFVERYFLELLLMPNQEEITTKLRMEHVNITSEVFSMKAIKKGLQDIVSAVSHNFSVYITCNNSRYSVSCLNDNKMLAKISFPVRYELITGFTKLEAESSVYPALLEHSKVPYEPLTSAYMSDYKDGMFCANEDYYVTEDIVSNTYYNKVNDVYVPVFSAEYLEESIYNLFNTGRDWGVMVNVRQDMYGGKKASFDIPLSDLACFLMCNGCSLYTGIRKYDKMKVEGVVMAVNMELGYQHIMMFSFDKGIFDNPKEHSVKIKMYSYVPIHNVSSIL